MSMQCPRCNHGEADRVAAAPGAWEVYLCARCFYTWRTSEPEAMLSHERYDARFRLSAEQLARFAVFPGIPRRR